MKRQTLETANNPFSFNAKRNYNLISDELRQTIIHKV